MSFITSHLRLSIPASLGGVYTFNRIEDPATRVPNIVAFMNDGEVDVTLHFDAGNNKAMLVSTVDASSGLVIDSTHKTLKLAIDGGDPFEFSLTTGSPRTRAEIITDINTALAAEGGSAALAQAVPVGTDFIGIVSGSSGVQSSVSILTPAANDVTATLGFTSGDEGLAGSSFVEDIVSPLTIKAKGEGTFVNPRKSSVALRIRGVAAVATMIDGTAMFSYSGVQQ